MLGFTSRERATPVADAAQPVRLAAAIRLLSLLACIGGVLLVRLAWKHLSYPEADPPLWLGLPFLALVAATMWLAARPDRHGRTAVERRWFWPVYLAAFIVTRVLILLLTPTQPFSDYATYMDFATRLATGTQLQEGQSYFLAWGYPLLLAGWFALVGPSLAAAQLLNVLLQLAALPFLARIGAAAGASGAKSALLWLYLIWPGALLMTPVPASEHSATLFTAAFLWLILSIAQGVGVRRWMRTSLAAGLCSAAAYIIRPASGVLLPAGLLTVLLCGRLSRGRWLRCIVIAGAFLLSVQAFQRAATEFVGESPPSVLCWNLLVGQNEESKGRWNKRDMRYFWFRGSLEASERAGWEELRRRLSRPLNRTIWLAWEKQNILWGDNYYATFWSTHELRPGPGAQLARAAQRWLYSSGQLVHILMLLGATAGLWLMWRGRLNPALLLALLCVLAGSVLHAVFETQSRYQHVFYLGVMILGSVATSELAKRFEMRRRDQAHV